MGLSFTVEDVSEIKRVIDESGLRMQHDQVSDLLRIFYTTNELLHDKIQAFLGSHYKTTQSQFLGPWLKVVLEEVINHADA